MAKVYGLIGNSEKFKENDMMANPPKGWGEAKKPDATEPEYRC
jgi:hypothetical protein